jgi:hypothetical protein
MRHLTCFLVLTAAGCLPARSYAQNPQCTLRLPQTTLAALPAPVGCQCPNGGPCSCGPDCPCGTACSCVACPGRTAVTLESLKSRAMADNKRLIVWTGTDGRTVPDCLACRDERCASVTGARPFVSVGVPSAVGLVWYQFAASVPDALLRSVRTDGTHDLLDQAAPSPYYQPAAVSFQGGSGGNCAGGH